jgi:hypothetical protein
MPATHPTDIALRDFLLGKLPNEEADSVEAHLSECPECLGRAADEPTSDTLVDLLTAAQTRLDQERAAARRRTRTCSRPRPWVRSRNRITARPRSISAP